VRPETSQISPGSVIDGVPTGLVSRKIVDRCHDKRGSLVGSLDISAGKRYPSVRKPGVHAGEDVILSDVTDLRSPSTLNTGDDIQNDMDFPAAGPRLRSKIPLLGFASSDDWSHRRLTLGRTPQGEC